MRKSSAISQGCLSWMFISEINSLNFSHLLIILILCGADLSRTLSASACPLISARVKMVVWSSFRLHLALVDGISTAENEIKNQRFDFGSPLNIGL